MNSLKVSDELMVWNFSGDIEIRGFVRAAEAEAKRSFWSHWSSGPAYIHIPIGTKLLLISRTAHELPVTFVQIQEWKNFWRDALQLPNGEVQPLQKFDVGRWARVLSLGNALGQSKAPAGLDYSGLRLPCEREGDS